MNRMLLVVFSLAVMPLLSLVALSHADDAGERRQNSEEPKKIIFFTPFDQPLAQALLKGQEVKPFQLKKKGVPPRHYSLSDIEKLSDQSPTPGTYFGVSLRIGQDSSTAAAVYLPKDILYLFAEIKDIKPKGTFQAKLQRLGSRSQDKDNSNQVRKFMTCEALVVPFPRKKKR